MTTRAGTDRAAGRAEPANDGLKRNAGAVWHGAMVLSVGFHAALFAVPILERQVAGEWTGPEAMQVLDLVETIAVAPEPLAPVERIRRPAAPTLPAVSEVVEPVRPDLRVPRIDVPLQPIEGPELPADPLAGFTDYISVSAVMTAPVLKNRSAVRRELVQQYQQGLRDRRSEGALALLLWIDETGLVRRWVIEHGDDSDAFSSAVAAAVPLMRFAPSVRWGRPMRVVVRMPIEFRVGGE